MAKRPRESEVLASSLVNSVTQALGKLLDLWDEMGINKELQLQRMQTAKAHIETLLNEMIDEESNLKEKIKSDIEIQREQLTVLRYQLGLDPYQVVDGLTILQLEKEYRLALESTVKLKQERLKKLAQLLKEDQGLCAELCATPYYIPTGSIPSSTELEELKEHVETLLKVKEERLEEFHKLRKEIRQYNKEIGHTPDGTLENNILADDEEEYICLTKKNLEDLQTLVHQLQNMKESMIATKVILEKEVKQLWNRLQWPQEKQEQFIQMTSQCSLCEATRMCEEELQHLEELKKEKLKEITLKVRQELDSYWQKCFYADEQKASFQPFYDDNFSEELLKQHDEELLKIKYVYESTKCLYDSINKWEAILDRFIELEKKSTDPSRLLNRGGNLLKDERERSKIQKQLSKLEEELKNKIENWEKEQNTAFLIRNQRFLDSMALQLQHHKLKKDPPKTSVKREESSASKTPMKRPAHVNTPTPSKIRKVASNLSVLKASSCSNIATKPSVQNKTTSKSSHLYSLYQPSLEECEKSKSTNQLSYSDFLKEFSIKSSINNNILNSTLKENLNK